MKTKAFLLILILAILHNLVCNGQNLPDRSRMFRIETTDGNIYTGSIVSEDQSILVLKTDRLGEIRIRQADIKSRIELKQVKEIAGQIWLPNPQSSR